MEIFVESSKTDQFRDGAWVVIARANSKLCPVAMLERYCALGGVTGDQEKFLFRGITTTKTTSKLRKSGGLSYTRAREVMLEMLEAIGLDKRLFGLHSLYVQAEPQLQPMLVWLTGFSRDMVDGKVKMRKMGM